MKLNIFSRNRVIFLALFLLANPLASFSASSDVGESESFKDTMSYADKSIYFSKSDKSKKKGMKASDGLSEVMQDRQRDPWARASWGERVRYFISEMRKGNDRIFLYAQYGLLDGYASPHNYRALRGGYPTMAGESYSNGVLRVLKHEADKKGLSIKEYLIKGSPDVRKNVIRSVLSGLFNKDPRVRLIAINLLRRLGPDTMMMESIAKALEAETVSTELIKWRQKDLDIPTVEDPRLGSDAHAWKKGQEYLSALDSKSIGYQWQMSPEEFLDGNQKGNYLEDGLYLNGDRNDYPVQIERYNSMTGKTHTYRVWTKSPLVRFGYPELVYKKTNGKSVRRVAPVKHVYPYLDYRDPESDNPVESIYYAYHNVWEELKRLDLFVHRAFWVNKVQAGDVNAVSKMSKDSFRAIADQIDGESLENVPMKSPSFKVFGEKEIEAVILGMLESKIVSTREECIRFLKRFYLHPSTSSDTKHLIKTALEEARRRELLIDTVRGRHVQRELLYFSPKPKVVPVQEVNVEVVEEKSQDDKSKKNKGKKK